MPHSSGGGSHGGGSHGGGGFHSGGSSNSGPHRSHTYFHGCRTYVYYRHHRPYYVYSDGPIVPQTLGGRLLGALIFFAIFCFLAFSVYKMVKPVKPLTGTDGYKIEIVDNTNTLGDTTALEAELKEFKDGTGITPYIIVDYNSVWIDKYNKLETYAYDLYVNKFNRDETHWLIIYTFEKDNPSNWYYEGMQGDDTDDFLTESKCDEFVSEFQRNFTLTSLTVNQAFTNSFEYINSRILEKDIELIPVIFMSLFGVAMLVGSVLSLLNINLNGYKDKDLVEVKGNVDASTGKVKERNCEYCGGVYVVGLHTSCPHCGASILAEDYNPESAKKEEKKNDKDDDDFNIDMSKY